MSSPDHIEQAIEMIIDSDRNVVDSYETPAPIEGSTVEKQQRKRYRSEVWKHFTQLDKRAGQREECRCNYCGQLYACSSRSGTGHLNRHIFEGRCQKYKAMQFNLQTSTPTPTPTPTPPLHEGEDHDNLLRSAPVKVSPTHTPNDSFHKENLEHMELQLARMKDENARLQKENDDTRVQKESLEKLLVNMASEAARLSEENSKLKEDYAKLQEEKERSVTREEFTRLEAQVSKLREEFEKDLRGFPATVAMALDIWLS